MAQRFIKGSSTFKCNVCGRLTRYTGAQSFGNQICPQCYDLAGIENEISDKHATAAERADEVAELIAEITAKGGDVAEWAALVAATTAPAAPVATAPVEREYGTDGGND